MSFKASPFHRTLAPGSCLVSAEQMWLLTCNLVASQEGISLHHEPVSAMQLRPNPASHQPELPGAVWAHAAAEPGTRSRARLCISTWEMSHLEPVPTLPFQVGPIGPKPSPGLRSGLQQSQLFSVCHLLPSEVLLHASDNLGVFIQELGFQEA